jgi:chemotaxis signal transduction protein
MTDTTSSSRLTDRAGELRQAFDRAFAVPATIDTAATEDLLAIRVGVEACAIRLSEIVGLFADKKITRVPGRAAALLGVAGFRGAIVPVYDLHILLGHPTVKTARWLVIASGAAVAFAFEGIDGHLRMPRGAILSPEATEKTRKCVSGVVRMQDVARAIVDLRAVLDVIRTQRPESTPAGSHEHAL